MNIHDIIRRPVITEKNTTLIDSGKYTFEVARDANKVQIKEAVEQIFSVKVLAVNVISAPAKQRRYKRIVGSTTPRKKAVVTLAKGQRIEIFEGV
jgi:large subunit ribosomal protein L23